MCLLPSRVVLPWIVWSADRLMPGARPAYETSFFAHWNRVMGPISLMRTHGAVVVEACESHQELHVWSIDGFLCDLDWEYVDEFFQALQLLHVTSRIIRSIGGVGGFVAIRGTLNVLNAELVLDVTAIYAQEAIEAIQLLQDIAPLPVR